MNFLIRLSVVVIFAAASSGRLAAQTVFQVQGTGVNSIQQKLGGADGKGLHMGWLVPPDKLVLDSQATKVYVYSSANHELAADFVGPLDPAALAKIRQQHCMPCGETGATPAQYYEYKVTSMAVVMAERVLASEAAIPDAQLGHKSAYRSKFLVKKAAGILGIKKGQLHKYLYYRSADERCDYSFHAFYDPKTKELKRFGRMLERRGVLIATDAQDFDSSKLCAKCKAPTYADSLDSVFHPVNLIGTSALPCPIILEDSSSGDDKGLSLVTYDLDGVKSEMRVRENTANCCK